MARFNTGSVGTKTENLAGGEAFSETSELEFASILLTSFVQDQFYRSANDTIKRIADLVKQLSDSHFAGQAALYTRHEYGMRSISHVVAGEIAAQVKGAKWTASFFDKIVRRPDDATEILSYYMGKYGKRPIPNALKKGLAKALTRFDEYQLAKYRGEGKELSLVDVVNLVRPKSTPALASLVAGTLRSTETWEAKISASQGDAAKKEDAWRQLLLERKIGYFALLRNLRNILQQAPSLVETACELLVDPYLIRKSLVLPLNYLTAMKELEKVPGANLVMQAIGQAMDIATVNVPRFDGRTLIALDTSGSMTTRPYRSRYESKWVPADIGAIFSAVILKANPTADLMTFSDEAQYVSVNPLDSTLTIAQRIPFRSGGTNFHSIFQTSRSYDRIIILSDMQAWMGYNSPTGSLQEYKRQTLSDPVVFSFDLAGYGTLQFPQRNVYALAGFSEKVFDVMKLLETDRNALVNEIKAIII